MAIQTTLRKALLLLSLGMAAAAQASPGALFSYNGKSYNTSDAASDLQISIYQVDNEHYKQREKLAELALFDVYMTEEAKRREMSRDELAVELLAINPPSSADVEGFYNQNRARIGAPLEQIRGEIAQYLVEQQRDAKRNAVIAKLKRDGSFKLLFAEPRAPQLAIETDGLPFKGNPDARVVVVEFADYQCPHCRQTSVELNKLMKKYGKQVKLVYKDFPINRSGISRQVAIGAVCADQQGQFWDFNGMAFELQAALSNDSPVEFAEALGMDMTKFKQCMGDPRTAARVRASKAEGDRLGITATPTVYINGRFTYDHDTPNDLETEIKKAIAEEY